LGFGPRGELFGFSENVPRQIPNSVHLRLLGMIDDDDFHRNLLSFQLQAELLLQSREALKHPELRKMA
jgi:hypothetical protein